MAHMRERYVWIGILERLEDSLRLLARLLPSYFGKMAVERAAREHVRPRSNASGYSYAPPSEATLAKLRIENANDLRLYAYAVELLDCRLATCSIPPQAERRAVGKAASLPAVGGQASAEGRAAAGDGSRADNQSAPPDVDVLAFRATANAAAAHLLRRRHRWRVGYAAPDQNAAKVSGRK